MVHARGEPSAEAAIALADGVDDPGPGVTVERLDESAEVPRAGIGRGCLVEQRRQSARAQPLNLSDFVEADLDLAIDALPRSNEVFDRFQLQGIERGRALVLGRPPVSDPVLEQRLGAGEEFRKSTSATPGQRRSPNAASACSRS